MLCQIRQTAFDPPTPQILDELKADFVKDYMPISQCHMKPNKREMNDGGRDGKPPV